MVRSKVAEIIPGLRAGVRPRDLLGRVQLLLLAAALANSAGALSVMLSAGASPAILFAAGIAAPVLLSATYVGIYRRRSLTFADDVLIIAALCVLAMAVENRWIDDVVAVLTAAVLFGAAYGSTSRVMIRTSLYAAVGVGLGFVEATPLGISVVFGAAFLVVAWLMHQLAATIDRYERAVRREHVLAAAGLDLVSAVNPTSIADAAVEGAHALCAALGDARVSMSVCEPDDSPPRFKVLRAMGRRSGELEGTVLDVEQLAPAGQSVADQRMMAVGEAPEGAEIRTDTDGDADADAEADGDCDQARSRLLPGEVLITRIAVGGRPRGVLVVESREPIPDEVPAAIHALATQVSLAIARTDLQRDAVARESAERFQALIHSSTDVISIVAADGRVLYQSPSVERIFGYEPDSMVGLDLMRMIHPDDEVRFVSQLQAIVREPGASVVCGCRLRHSDGSWRNTETRLTNLLDTPAVNGVVLNTRDVTERLTLEAELRHQAFHDSLTGLANRTLFADRAEHALLSSRRDDSTVAVLFCAMNGLKKLNDNLGYTAGDAALVIVAERLRNCVRGQDTVARLGGNEFGLLLDRLSSPADATMAMERIIGLLREPLDVAGSQVELQPQIGIAISSGGNGNADELLRNAAVAMHEARRMEGGYALFDPDMHRDAVRRIEFESQLRTAVDQKQFMVYYQPTIDLQTGRFTGVEALVRWQHPHRGIVPPLEFIPLAEESGLIVPLGQWIMQEACRQVRIWQREIPADEPIALNVNLSARQLRHPNLVRDVADALDDSGLLPSRLILEITESVLMIDTAATLNRLFQLKSLGVRLAVDDFGTGYSSFAYLRRFPVDILKIDKSFVDGVASEPTASALVDAMIRIGKTLRLETVAEGVEHRDQADRLRTLQCDIGQGYLFSRPVPSDAITQMLRDRSIGSPASGPQENAA